MAIEDRGRRTADRAIRHPGGDTQHEFSDESAIRNLNQYRGRRLCGMGGRWRMAVRTIALVYFSDQQLAWLDLPLATRRRSVDILEAWQLAARMIPMHANPTI